MPGWKEKHTLLHLSHLLSGKEPFPRNPPEDCSHLNSYNWVMQPSLVTIKNRNSNFWLNQLVQWKEAEELKGNTLGDVSDVIL